MEGTGRGRIESKKEETERGGRIIERKKEN